MLVLYHVFVNFSIQLTLEFKQNMCYNDAKFTIKEKNMKLFAPKYYKEFKCIADKCEHSCCVGWEIDVDSDTLEKYQSLKSEYASAIKDSICMSDTPHFVLCEGDRCPHLDENGLCRIILNEGEDFLCDICREHPRFYNFTSVAEVGLGMSCREAARVILSCDNYWELEFIGEVDAPFDDVDFDGAKARLDVYEILRDRSIDYTARLDKIYNQYLIDAGDDEKWLSVLDELEYLDTAHKDIFMNYSRKRRPNGNFEYLERFLAYLIYRHTTEAMDAEDFCDRLAFCLFCERLLASLMVCTSAQNVDDVAFLASIISEEIEYSDENTSNLMYL